MDDQELKNKLQDFLRKDLRLAFFENKIPSIEETIRYHFSNKGLFIQAFTRSSYAVEQGVPSNEVLEFIGDKIIDIAVVKAMAGKFGLMMPGSNEDGYQYFTISTNQTEKDFTEIKKKLVCNEYLASVIELLKLDDYLLMGRSDIEGKVNKEIKVKADLLEAIIGAIAIDSNWDRETLNNVCDYMLSIDANLDLFKLPESTDVSFDLENAVSVLKELSEHGRCSTPVYLFGDEAVRNEDGSLVWSCGCFVKSHNIFVTVYAPSKKIGKMNCAYSALCQLFKIKNKYM